MKAALLALLARFVAWLNRKAYEEGYRDGQAAARREQERAADALREDYDAYGNDDRNLDAALGHLRSLDSNGRRLP